MLAHLPLCANSSRGGLSRISQLRGTGVPGYSLVIAILLRASAVELVSLRFLRCLSAVACPEVRRRVVGLVVALLRCGPLLPLRWAFDFGFPLRPSSRPWRWSSVSPAAKNPRAVHHSIFGILGFFVPGIDLPFTLAGGP